MSQCQQIVYVRDTYRYSGRSPGGFSLHYNRQQCSRPVKKDGLCWQHQPGYLQEQSIKWLQRKFGRPTSAGVAEASDGG